MEELQLLIPNILSVITVIIYMVVQVVSAYKEKKRLSVEQIFNKGLNASKEMDNKVHQLEETINELKKEVKSLMSSLSEANAELKRTRQVITKIKEWRLWRTNTKLNI